MFTLFKTLNISTRSCPVSLSPLSFMFLKIEKPTLLKVRCDRVFLPRFPNWLRSGNLIQFRLRKRSIIARGKVRGVTHDRVDGARKVNPAQFTRPAYDSSSARRPFSFKTKQSKSSAPPFSERRLVLCVYRASIDSTATSACWALQIHVCVAAKSP